MKKKDRTLRVFLLLISLMVLIIVGLIAYIQLKPVVVKAVTVEAGTEMVEVDEFLLNKNMTASYVTNLEDLDLNRPGTHEVQIKVGNKIHNSILEVIDTTAPTASTIDQEIWNDEELSPDVFVKNIQDATEVTVSYKETPDFTTPGNHVVTVLLVDESGNQSEVNASLTVIADTEAPVISGLKDKTITIGESISYKKDIKVTDNRDTDISFEVDSSKVNLKKEGNYPVTYTAIDSSGNKTTETIHIKVKTFMVSEDTLNTMADDILSKITNSSMTYREIAYEIYRWTKSHIAYTGNSDKSDWMAEAYRGIKNAAGDCFTYFSVSQALLNRAGIDNIPVTRVGGKTRHYWSLVNCGDGWYHFDTTRHKDGKNTFMLTDKEVEEYTEIRGNNYYTFDKTLYPATPEE